MRSSSVTRRHCLELGLGLGLGLPAAAQGNPERLALVIGNSAYLDSPLRNPGNDARAMAALLGRAGFQVDFRSDTSRADLLQAITRFGQDIRDARTRMAVFYYAGHGLQQDWKNHLVPVDARVRNSADVARQTVELGELVRRMSQAQGTDARRTFLVILDACRDDPFAGGYRPAAQGLVPFDAPVGCVLAYATAPGRVALDGDGGGNGLYTKHLLRELSVPEASIEDVFKRVRLNVRVESRGRQVPWEMASLEDPVFLFQPQRAVLSEADLQRRFEAELAAWTQVQQAPDVSALVQFIRQYPSGNASELAQARLNRLLADEVRKAAATLRPGGGAAAIQQSDPQGDRLADQLADRLLAQGTAPATPAPSAGAAPTPVPAAEPIILPVPAPASAAGVAAVAPPVSPPVAIPAPALPVAAEAPSLPPTPYFSGQDTLQRDFRLGQRLEFRVIDALGKPERALTLRVTALDRAADRVEFNGGESVSDLMGNTRANARGTLSTPRQFYPTELVLGRRWVTEFRQARPSGMTYTFRYRVRVAGRENVTVPAGRFEAWRIEAEGFNVGLSAYIRRTLWVVPGLPADVAAETYVRLRNGIVEQNERQELVAVHAG